MEYPDILSYILQHIKDWDMYTDDFGVDNYKYIERNTGIVYVVRITPKYLHFSKNSQCVKHFIYEGLYMLYNIKDRDMTVIKLDVPNSVITMNDANTILLNIKEVIKHL